MEINNFENEVRLMHEKFLDVKLNNQDFNDNSFMN
jgi:hypothetical protein